MEKTQLDTTVGTVLVREAREDGSLLLEIRPGDEFTLSSSGKSYIATFGSGNVVIKGEQMRLAVTYTLNIAKHARSEGAAKTKTNPFRHGTKAAAAA